MALLGTITAFDLAVALPTCADLATNPAWGLAGNPAVSAASTTQIAATAGPPATPTYCQVDFTVSTLSGSANGYDVGEAQAIKIRVVLPEKAAWVGKMMSGTGPGMQGSVGPWANYGEGTTRDTGLGYAIRLGYVGTTTDTGHGAGSAWGVIQTSNQLNHGTIKDSALLGSHYSVQWGKALAKTYYGTAVTRNYWNGCSGSGWQGMGQLQKWGDEFDGFLIGAPAFYWQTFRLADAWPAIVQKKLAQIGTPLTAGHISAANAAAAAACDGNDGVVDGILTDPRQCTWSATANICGQPGAPDAPSCLDANQAAAIDRIWDGPRNHKGKRIWFPYDRGINFSASTTVGGSTTQVMSWNHKDATFSGNNLYVDAESLALGGNPANGITYENEATLGSNTTTDYVDNSNPALDKARNGGTKIILMHGTADGAIRWRHSVDYYRRVASYFGGGIADFANLQSWFRFFPMPHVGHCGGGVGPSPTDPFLALVNWVENGVTPNTLLAVGGTANPSRTRSLCPYPTTAIYNGSGSTDDAANFHCGGNLETPAVVADSMRAKYKFENQ